jgi:hypothetical protein
METLALAIEIAEAAESAQDSDRVDVAAEAERMAREHPEAEVSTSEIAAVLDGEISSDVGAPVERK